MTTAQASLKATKARPLGYLPKDRPPLPALIAFGLQHVLTMFPATVFVAILTGFDVGVTLFASGLATVVALLGSGMRIPMYYGSSFSYIAAVVAVVGAEWGGIRVAQGGIVVTSIVSVLAGLLIRRMGKAALDKVLPPVITGSVAIVIGISLAYTALDMASAALARLAVHAADDHPLLRISAGQGIPFDDPRAAGCAGGLCSGRRNGYRPVWHHRRSIMVAHSGL